MKKTFFLFIVAAAASALALAKETTVYLEEFDNLGDYVACFNKGAAISEAPASLKSLSFNPEIASDARRGFFRIATPPKSKNYVVHFAFQMPVGEKPREFGLKLYFGDAEKPVMKGVVVAEKGSYFSGEPSPKEGMPGFLGAWQWNKGAIVVADGKATLYVFRNGVLTADATGTFPKAPLVGWNLSAASPVSIDSVRVVDDCLRPYMIGDIADWTSRTAPADDGVFAPPKDAAVLTNRQEMAFVPETGKEYCFAYRCGDVDRAKENAVDFLLENGKKASLTFRAVDGGQKVTLRNYNSAKGQFENISTNVALPDAYTLVSGPGFRAEDYAIPRLQYRYEDPDILQVVAARDKLPRASRRVVTVRLRPLCANWTTNEVWIDARYAGQMRLEAPVKSLAARFSGEPQFAAYQVCDMMAAFADSRFLALDVDGLNRPYGTVPALKGVPNIQKVPFALARPAYALNLAFCRENKGSFALECNGYLSRSAFDGMPSSMHFSVPVAQYVRAYALCAADPAAPADFIPTVTARLTHYLGNGGRSQAACECTRLLPAKAGGELPEGVTVFGEAEGGVPVYLVAFDFDIGSIQDLTSMLDLDHLDLDFVGCLWDKDTYYLSRRRSPSYERQSSVQIYGATLEKTPVEMVVAPNRKNSVYYPNETPGATVSLKPVAPGEYTVSVELSDTRGKVVKSTSFTAAEPVEKALDFSTLPYGHYTVSYVVSGADGAPVITHRGSLAMLPPDTRKAGYESPYYVWNFRGAHGTPRQLEDYGDMLMRMGVRRTLLDDVLCETNDLVKPYKLTLGQFPFYTPRPRNGQTREEAIAELKGTIRDKMAKFPHCRTAIIFHESGGGVFPQELIDGHTEVTPAIAAGDTNRLNTALTTAKIWREIDPGVRLILGNSGSSVGIMGQLFRAGYPKDMIDAMGDESVGMTQPPERSVAYPSWTLRKLARTYGYDAVPDAPWEWKSRVFRHQGEAMFAAMKVRDALVAHAWNYSCIPLCGLTEMANSYYDTIWGEGCFERWPLAYPHQCFTATATMTLLLDGATFTRMLPTGSLTTYCLEFRKPDTSYVYALWTARADVKVALQASDEGVKKLTVVDMLGVADKVDVGADFVVGPCPCYVSTEAPLGGVKINEEFALRREPLQGVAVVQPLASTSEVRVVCGKDPRIEIGREDPPFLAFHRAGEFSVSVPEGGDCIELTRTSTNACPELVQEYAFLTFPEAKPAEGTPSTIGVWVKGNSSWGKLYFEFADAEGEKWLSAGTGGYGCMVYDWPEQASLNFDGWQFVEFPITRDSPVKIFSPGENEWQWQRDGEKGNGKVDYPITITGLGVGMYPHALNLLEMEETPRSILLKDLSVY